MSLIAKIVIALVIAAIAATVATVFQDSAFAAVILYVSFCAATIITALLVTLPPPAAATAATKRAGAPAAGAPAARKPARQPAAEPSGAGAPAAGSPAGTAVGPREEGSVKWFNVSKGFGFITRESGEEIFVHFRSIRGEGRRGLRDGQQVTFVVAQSDKGPQAEDVEGLD